MIPTIAIFWKKVYYSNIYDNVITSTERNTKKTREYFRHLRVFQSTTTGNVWQSPKSQAVRSWFWNSSMDNREPMMYWSCTLRILSITISVMSGQRFKALIKINGLQPTLNRIRSNSRRRRVINIQSIISNSYTGHLSSIAWENLIYSIRQVLTYWSVKFRQRGFA